MSSAVTESTFEQEVLKSDKPVIVDFWAEWCGPCHAVSPILDKIAEERAGELTVVKVNIDEEQGLAERYGIASIPTIVLFKDGEPAAAAIGAQPKGAIEKQLGSARDERLGGRPRLPPPPSRAAGSGEAALRGRLVHEIEHAHPVHEHVGAAEPAAHGQHAEADERQDQRPAADRPVHVVGVSRAGGDREQDRRGQHRHEMRGGGSPERRPSA